MLDSIFKNTLSSRVYEVAERTPLDLAKNLSGRLSNNIYLKREDLQSIFSFKIRGAYNKIAHLTEQQKSNGLFCASAGNHAQGVALSAAKLRIAATIVMPETTPSIKVAAVERFGAKVILIGDSYSDAALYCRKLVRETNGSYIHPFDDPLVISGQGTIGQEILQQCPDVDYVFVPVGGGGLIAGIASFIKQLKPDTKIIGVEPEDSNAMGLSVKINKRVKLSDVGIFADGVAVKEVGELPFELVKRRVDELITVATDEICSAIKSIYEETRTIVEPAGALGVAGAVKYLKDQAESGCLIEDRNIVAVNSGANMNFDRLRFVAERSLIGEKREALFAVTLTEKRGALKYFCEKVIGERSITEFNYRLMNRKVAHILLSIGVESDAERVSFGKTLEGADLEFSDLTNNELAKTHIRYMVGGKSLETRDEVLYRFEFPERPKALTDFLSAMEENWNISLFHYRSHGSDFGRVLIGFEIPKIEEGQFQDFLQNLNYSYDVETGNPAYRMFL